MIKGPKLRLKAIAPRMAQKTLRELKVASETQNLSSIEILIFLNSIISSVP
jgi:hypothetical protein